MVRKHFPKYIKKLETNGVFIPILDYDPVEAARCLIYYHLETAIKIIAASLTLIHIDYQLRPTFIKKVGKKGLLCLDVIWSTANIVFYSKMYEEMQSIHEEACGKRCSVVSEFKEEYLYDTNISMNKCANGELLIRPALYYKNYNKSLQKKQFSNNFFDGLNAVNSYRKIYLYNRYTYDQFPVGAPVWYSSFKRIIFQKFDFVSRKHVRITTDEKGNYKYYVAFISDRWVEIENVPKEMRDVIDSILKGRRSNRTEFDF